VAQKDHLKECVVRDGKKIATIVPECPRWVALAGHRSPHSIKITAALLVMVAMKRITRWS
jgi:hypothetical protein